VSVLVLPVHKHDHIRGNRLAPVKLVQYGDFECGQSGLAYGVVSAIDEVLRDLVCTVYRHCPTMHLHQHAQFAAEAAEAAAVQGKFWEMHDLLFEHQHSLALPFLVHYADMIGLDMHEFATDMVTHRLAEQVRSDCHSGLLSGVERTPTFFINGHSHEGPFDYGTLSRAIHRAAESAAAGLAT
jgi:protein-disulfide isomerase